MAGQPETAAAKKPAPKRSARAALGNLVTKIVIYPLAFLATIVVDRTLGPHDRGLFAFLLLVGNFAMPLMTFGFGGAVIYYISSGDYESEEVSFTALLFGLAIGLVCAGITYGLWRLDWLGETGGQTPLRELLAMLAIVPLQGVQLMAGRVLFGESRFGTSNWVRIARSVANPLLLVVLVVVAKMGLWGAVLATVVLNVGVTLSMLWVLSPTRLMWRYHHGFFVEGMRYGLKMWVGDLATRANLRLDQVLLGIFAPASALGNYSVAVRLAEFLWIGPDAVTPVLFNRLAAAKDDEQRIALTARIHRVGLAFLLVIAIFAGVAGWWVIPFVLGEKFAEANLLFELLLFGTVGFYSSKVITKYFAAAGRPDLAGRLGIYSAIAGTVLYAVLIPLGATVGAAIASSLAYIMFSVIAWRMYVRIIAPAPTQLFAFSRDDVTWVTSQVRNLMQRRRRRATPAEEG
ncbi:MAG TPA: hypothetical protein ENK57_06635 [Polyangiaceae bacterium]|nr:hypothetical protein [Polyangiaceae bacterium]